MEVKKNVCAEKKNKESFLLLRTLLQVCKGLEVCERKVEVCPGELNFLGWVQWNAKIKDLKSPVKPALNIFDFGSNQDSDKTSIWTIFQWFSKLTWSNSVTDSRWPDLVYLLHHYLFYVTEPTQQTRWHKIDQQTCCNTAGLIWDCWYPKLLRNCFRHGA